MFWVVTEKTERDYVINLMKHFSVFSAEQINLFFCSQCFKNFRVIRVFRC